MLEATFFAALTTVEFCHQQTTLQSDHDIAAGFLAMLVAALGMAMSISLPTTRNISRTLE